MVAGSQRVCFLLSVLDEEAVMDEQVIPEPYAPPSLIEVGEFSEDTLGGTGDDKIDSFTLWG